MRRPRKPVKPESRRAILQRLVAQDAPLHEVDGMSNAKRSEPTPGEWRAIGGTPLSGPARVVHIYFDEKGRRCTATICTCESTTEPNDRNAVLIAAVRELRDELKQARTDVQNLLAELAALEENNTSDLLGEEDAAVVTEIEARYVGASIALTKAGAI